MAFSVSFKLQRKTEGFNSLHEELPKRDCEEERVLSVVVYQLEDNEMLFKPKVCLKSAHILIPSLSPLHLQRSRDSSIMRGTRAPFCAHGGGGGGLRTGAL